VPTALPHTFSAGAYHSADSLSTCLFALIKKTQHASFLSKFPPISAESNRKGGDMKSSTSILITAMVLTPLALPAPLGAQHTRYQLVDLGTLGGPASYRSGFGDGETIVNERGFATGISDTSIPDPNCSGCFYSQAFQWKNGVLSDLGTFPGGHYSYGNAINALGWIAGSSDTGEFDPLTGSLAAHAVLWKNSEMIDLGTLGAGLESATVYVANAGEAVGYSTVDTVPDPFLYLGASPHPFIWKNGAMRDLGTLGGPDAMPTNGCNEQRGDLVAGWSLINSTPNLTTGFPTQHAFVWENGTMVDIPTLGGTLAGAQCANNRGQVVGQSNLIGDSGCNGSTSSCDQHPFLWDHGTLVDLGALGGSYSVATWLNDAGEAVGGSWTAGDELFHATLWKHGAITDLGALGDDCYSLAQAVNSQHEIVGRSFSCDFSLLRAALWEKGTAIDLNTLIPANSSLRLVEAVDITDRGEIYGRGLPQDCGELDEDQCGHDFVLIPCEIAGRQNCQDNIGILSAIVQNSVAPIHRRTTAPQTRPARKGSVPAWRRRLAARQFGSGS
jgi:probable HAF family extracellular repeat protein